MLLFTVFEASANAEMLLFTVFAAAAIYSIRSLWKRRNAAIAAIAVFAACENTEMLPFVVFAKPCRATPFKKTRLEPHLFQKQKTPRRP